MKYTLNQFYSTDRIPLGKSAPLDTPLRFAISLSEVCNLKCIYCFRSVTDTLQSGYTTEKFMSWEIFNKVVEQMKEFPSPIKKVFFNVTGEPLCHKDMPKMVKHFKSQMPEPITAIQTNATLLNPQLSEQIVDSGLDQILISLQGLSGTKYKEMCGVYIDFDKLFENIAYLYKIRGETKIYVKVPDIALGQDEEATFLQLFSPICNQATIERINPIFSEVDYTKITGVSNDTANRVGTDFGKQRVCPIAFYHMVVTTNGNVYPCVQSRPPFSLGKIQNNSCKEIWNGSSRMDLLKDLLKRNFVPVCADCVSVSACIKSEEDIIDPYSDEILDRILRSSEHE